LAIAACLVVWRKIIRCDFWDFFNNIGTFETCRPPPKRSALRGIEDIYELTYVGKDGSQFPAVVSVTALRDV
jgi:hypothetical protein